MKAYLPVLALAGIAVAQAPAWAQVRRHRLHRHNSVCIRIHLQVSERLVLPVPTWRYSTDVVLNNSHKNDVHHNKTFNLNRIPNRRRSLDPVSRPRQPSNKRTNLARYRRSFYLYGDLSDYKARPSNRDPHFQTSNRQRRADCLPRRHQLNDINFHALGPGIRDSISVGYGLDGVSPCTNTAALENNPKTYAALAAKALEADYSAIAWSGEGLVRNIATEEVDDSPLMTELYTRYGANDADNSYPFASASTEWTPDAVVKALGTNDFGYLAYDTLGQAYPARPVINATEFTAGMVDFVNRIQDTYYLDANIHFFLMASPMLSDTWPTAADAQRTTLSNALKAAIGQIGEHAHFVDWQPQGIEVGCDYHPNAATNAAQGLVLAEVLSAVLGW